MTEAHANAFADLGLIVGVASIVWIIAFRRHPIWVLPLLSCVFMLAILTYAAVSVWA